MNAAKIIILSCMQDKTKEYFVFCDYSDYSDRSLLFNAITEYDLCLCIRYHGVKYSMHSSINSYIWRA